MKCWWAQSALTLGNDIFFIGSSVGDSILVQYQFSSGEEDGEGDTSRPAKRIRSGIRHPRSTDLDDKLLYMVRILICICSYTYIICVQIYPACFDFCVMLMKLVSKFVFQCYTIYGCTSRIPREIQP